MGLITVVLLWFEFPAKRHLPIGQLKNRTRQPDSKIHQPRAIGHYFLCTLLGPRAKIQVIWTEQQQQQELLQRQQL